MIIIERFERRCERRFLSAMLAGSGVSCPLDRY
jgi:hypothetical protein